MRAPATFRALFLGILLISLASCSVEPHVRENTKNELGKLKGPATSSIDAELSNQADQAVTAGDYRQAVQIYKQLVDKSPENMNFQRGYAESLRRAGDCGRSLKVTDVVLAKDAGDAGALENKGLCLMATGEFTEAGVVFGDVMKADRKRWRTLNGIGILFAMKGKYDGAMAYFQEALNVSTDNPSVLNNAALTYAIDQQFGRSYDAFGRAKRHVSPGSADMKHLDLNLALVYAVSGKLDLAEQTASPYLSKEGLYNNMGFYSYLAKNNDLAKGYLNMALTQSPTYYERAWKNMGALTGDAGSSVGQAMPVGMGYPDGTNGALPGLAQSTLAPPSQPAGIALDDIPESKPLHASSDAPVPTPAAGKTPVSKSAPHTNDLAVQDPVSAKKPANTPDDSDAAPPAKPQKSDPDADAAKVPAPELNIQPKAQDSPATLNPDVVLLHTPAPGHNSDWDFTKSNDAAAINAVVPGGGPAAGGAGN